MNKFYNFCTNTDLHVTVILPGGCNAKCSFCYDISEINIISNYKRELENTIKRIPTVARKFAITGMEPSYSPYFKECLELAKKYKEENRFDFIFLNTNGSNILKYIDLINESLDSINISRHSANDSENYKIFNTESVPSKEELKRIISCLKLDSGVNINTVLTDDLTEEEKIKKTNEMIEFCKYVGADSLTLRFEATDTLRKEQLPKYFLQFDTILENSNPGCRFWLKRINDFNVVLKYVTKEPTSYSNWNYGFIIQRDFKITRDWKGLKMHSLTVDKVIK